MFKVSSCCGCNSLKSGAMAISAFNLIMSFLAFILLFYITEYLIVVVMIFTSIVVSIMAICGVETENERLIFPLMSAYFVNSVLTFPIHFIQSIQNAILTSQPTFIYFIIFFVSMIGLAIGVHFFAVLYSYSDELLRQKISSPKPHNPEHV